MNELTSRIFPIAWTLSGFIFFLAGFLLSRFPPKRINSIYGYRTPRSMQSPDAWKFAQKESARLLKKSGAGLIIAGILTLSLPPFSFATELALTIAGILMAAILPAYYTEKALKDRFDDRQHQ